MGMNKNRDNWVICWLIYGIYLRVFFCAYGQPLIKSDYNSRRKCSSASLEHKRLKGSRIKTVHIVLMNNTIVFFLFFFLWSCGIVSLDQLGRNMATCVSILMCRVSYNGNPSYLQYYKFI